MHAGENYLIGEGTEEAKEKPGDSRMRHLGHYKGRRVPTEGTTMIANSIAAKKAAP